MPKYNKEELEKAIKDSTNYAETLRLLSLRAAGGNFKTLKKYVSLWNINTSHFTTASERIKILHSHNFFKPKKLLEEILTENSTHNRSDLKKKLYKHGIKKRECEFCGQGELWNGKHMSLILDHINGVYNDNRLENLRILCPNCNATLDTHCGRKNKLPKIDKRFGKKPNRPKNYKINWPPIEELQLLVKEQGFLATGRLLGVSDNAVRKHLKSQE